MKIDDGQHVALSDLRGKPVVLYFYPKANTPGCTTEGSEFRDAKPQFDEASAVILGCSADSVESQAKFKAKYKFNFSLLSDPEFRGHRSFKRRAAHSKSFLGKSYLGIVLHVFDRPDGRVAKIWDSVRAKGHAAEVLEAAEPLSSTKLQ